MKKTAIKKPKLSVYIAGNNDFTLPIGGKSVWRLAWKHQWNVLVLVENICKDYWNRNKVVELLSLFLVSYGIWSGRCNTKRGWRAESPMSSIVQGIALGKRIQTTNAPCKYLIPRAVPWAVESCPFGARCLLITPCQCWIENY